MKISQKTIKKYFLQKILVFKTNQLAVWLMVVVSILMGLFVWQGWRHFQFPVLDLGLYNRHMWGLVRLDFSANPLKGFNLLGDHSHFILFLLAPVYALFQTPITLLVAQVLCISLSGWPIYLIAKKYFKNNAIAALWLVPYYMYFGFWSALAYPFHVSAIAVLPMSWALYFMLEKKYCYMIPAVILMVLTKEDMPLVAIMMGLYLVIIQRKYWLGAVMAGVSGLYFVFVLKIWLPTISGIGYYYADTSISLKAALTKPLDLITQFISPREKFDNLLSMILSFAGLSLIGIEIFILLLPIWMGRFLSVQYWRWTSEQHYSANQGPILAAAAIIGTYRLVVWMSQNRQLSSKQKQIFFISILAVCIFSSLFVWKNLDLRSSNIRKVLLQKSPAVEASANKALALIPRSASVGVQSIFPQATSRKEVYNLPLDLNSQKPDYLILSTSLGTWGFSGTGDVQKYAQRARALGYTTVLDENGIYLLKKP